MSQVNLILVEGVHNLGEAGDLVSVKPGYARNFLLPQRKALRATKDNIAQFETQRGHLEADNLQRRDEAEAVAKRLEGMAVVLIRQAGDNGQLYGSVNSRDLAQSIKEAGVTVDRKQVTLEKVIKMLGLHQVRVRLHPEVSVEVTANVARSDAEAAAQTSSGHMVSADEQRETEEETIEAVIVEVEVAEEAEAEAEAAQDDDGEDETPAESAT